MSDTTLPPLVIEFDVDAPLDHAFATWVDRAGTWWPKSHSRSGDPRAVVFEPRVGGRIFERDAAGDEHTWAEVVVWEPPRRLECMWHLGFPPDEATRLAITFTPDGASTRVRLEQSGWDVLGAAGEPRRERTTTAWTEVTDVYRAHLDHERDAREGDAHERAARQRKGTP